MNDVQKQLAELKARYAVIAECKPLAVGVRAELVAAGYDVDLIGRSLYIHAQQIRYQRKIAQGGQRHHLDGSEAGEIDPGHAEFARHKVAEYDEREVARRLRVKEQKALKAAKQARLAAAESLAVAPPPVKVVAKPIAKILPATKTPPVAPAVPVVVKKRRSIVVPK